MRASHSLVTVAAGAVLLAAGTACLAWRPAGRAPPGTLLPGDEVNLSLARGGVVVQGDAADPLESFCVNRNDEPLPDQTAWMRRDRGCAVIFCDAESGPVTVDVATRYRKIRRELQANEFRAGVELRRIELQLPESFPPEGVPDTALCFAPDGRYVAIGSAGGELKVVPTVELDAPRAAPGRIERHLAEGIAKAVAFAAGGEVLVVGEQSPDAFVYGLATGDGRELWKMRLADELGTSSPSPTDYLPPYSYPGAYRLLPLPDGDILVLGLHSWRPRAETRRALARIYRLAARTGEVRWRFPAEAPAARGITWMDAARDGARLACVMSVPGAGQVGAPEAPLDLVVLDGARGVETGRLSLEPLKPHFTSVFSWQALSMRPDGKGGVLGADDGRLWSWEVDDAGRPSERWRIGLGTPLQAGGLSVHRPIGWALATSEALYAELDRNSEKFGADAQTGRPADVHPEGGSIQAFDPRAPERLWRYDVPARPRGLWLSPDGRWLGFAYEKPAGADARGKPTPPDYGVCMFDLRQSGPGNRKLQYRFPTDGPVGFAACFSPDGRYLAVTEGPQRGEDRTGAARTYRVLILH